jgi:hypothetical protein
MRIRAGCLAPLLAAAMPLNMSGEPDGATRWPMLHATHELAVSWSTPESALQIPGGADQAIQHMVNGLRSNAQRFGRLRLGRGGWQWRILKGQPPWDGGIEIWSDHGEDLWVFAGGQRHARVGWTDAAALWHSPVALSAGVTLDSARLVPVPDLKENCAIAGLACSRTAVLVRLHVHNALLSAPLVRELRFEVWHTAKLAGHAWRPLAARWLGPQLAPEVLDKALSGMGFPLRVKLTVSSWLSDGSTPEPGSFDLSVQSVRRLRSERPSSPARRSREVPWTRLDDFGVAPHEPVTTAPLAVPAQPAPPRPENLAPPGPAADRDLLPREVPPSFHAANSNESNVQ